jgi:glycosyltransferase involved in cell wall biosynthesis
MKKSFKLSVIMPVYNEVNTVEEIIRRVLRRREVYELVVVDDGSTDSTVQKLKGLKCKKLTIVYKDRNEGKGAAIKTGLETATGTHIIIQDSDLEYDPRDYRIMIAQVLEGKAEVVYGSRFYGPHKNMLFWHKLANDALNLLVNILFDTTISDCETCYKLIPAELLRSLKITSARFDFEIEVTCKILKQGIRIWEVPISYAGREYKDGKKIKFRDGVTAFLRVLQYRFL